ncbi:unnamed protein product [Symbiodinium natans]|uniref:RRM domain-containing protein n=1 Tax=Symbiodinium natans TaxID=878477 RepID=A0A812UB90_9DINO|nr:unnamed protein product [Symbiodinium natans]
MHTASNVSQLPQGMRTEEFGLHPSSPEWYTCTKMMIRNVPARCTEPEMYAYLRTKTPSNFVLQMPKTNASKCKGYAFVLATSPHEVAELAKALWQQRVPGRMSNRPLKIHPAEHAEPTVPTVGGANTSPLPVYFAQARCGGPVVNFTKREKDAELDLLPLSKFWCALAVPPPPGLEHLQLELLDAFATSKTPEAGMRRLEASSWWTEEFGLHPSSPEWYTCTKMMIRNVPARCTEPEMYAYLRTKTPSNFVLQMPKTSTSKCKGYAFVLATSPHEIAELAKALWQQRVPSRMSNRPLKIHPAEHAEPTVPTVGGAHTSPLPVYFA